MGSQGVDVRKIASGLAGRRTARYVLELEGPFTPYDGPDKPGRMTVEVERDLPISSPALLEALNAGAQEGFEYREEDMEGPHQFTIEIQLYEPGERRGDYPTELEAEDYEVVAIDGMRAESETDRKKLSGVVSPDRSDIEKVVSRAVEDAKESWAEGQHDI